SEHAGYAHESPAAMLVPMGVLVACCFLIGLAPLLTAPILAKGVAAWAPGMVETGPDLGTLAPLDWITFMGLALTACLLAPGTLLRVWLRQRGVEKDVTWGCGYVAPTPRMQYTSSSFAQMLVGLFGWALHPRTYKTKDLPLFPEKADFHSDVPETVLDEAVLPAGWLVRGRVSLGPGVAR